MPPTSSRRLLSNGLTAREEAFIQVYLRDFNALKAYCEVTGRSPGNTRGSYVSRMLQRPRVVAEIERRLVARRIEYEGTVKRTIDELARVAFSNIGAVLDWGIDDYASGEGLPRAFVHLVPAAALLPEEVASIKRIKQTRHGVDVELHDKVQALIALAKHFGLLNGQGRDEIDANGVPKIPLATMRLLQKRDAELQQKLAAMGMAEDLNR